MKECNDRKLNVVTRSMELLGGRVGVISPGVSVDSSDSDRLLRDTITDNKSHAQMMEHLRHPAMPTQHSLRLLRSCVLPQVSYVMRTTPADVSRATLVAFDRDVIKTAMAKLGIDDDELPQPSVLSAPYRAGGIALRQQSTIADIAFFLRGSSTAIHQHYHRSSHPLSCGPHRHSSVRARKSS